MSDTPRTFEEWIESQPMVLQRNLTERDEAMKRDAFDAGKRSAEAELAAAKTEIEKLREERDAAFERGMREAGKRIFGDRAET